MEKKPKTKIRCGASASAFFVLLTGPSFAFAQATGPAPANSTQTTSTGSGPVFPNRPIRVFTAGIGGSSDLVARLLAQEISIPLGQRVVVENRGNPVQVAEIVMQAPADGYTMLIYGSAFWLGPLLQRAPYDPTKNFSPVTMAIRQPYLLVVHPTLPVKSVRELIALARARPGELNYSSAGSGSISHISGELFKSMARVNMVRVPYKASSLEATDLLSGLVQLTFGSGATVLPYVKAGRLRALAVTSAQPTALVPGLPTVAASGLPGYESETMTGIFVLAGTPLQIIDRLNKEIAHVLSRADTKERFYSMGVEAGGNAPEEFAARMKSEMIKVGKILGEAGIRAD